jgi:hypothetical protein
MAPPQKGSPMPPSQGLQRLQPVMEENPAEVDSPTEKRHRSRRSNFGQIVPVVVPPSINHQKNGQRTDINYE